LTLAHQPQLGVPYTFTTLAWMGVEVGVLVGKSLTVGEGVIFGISVRVDNSVVVGISLLLGGRVEFGGDSTVAAGV
jgi:hypothetical protein